MLTGIEFIVETMLEERGLTRRAYDDLPDWDQERMLGHYLAKQQLVKWQNYKSWRQLEKVKAKGG